MCAHSIWLTVFDWSWFYSTKLTVECYTDIIFFLGKISIIWMRLNRNRLFIWSSSELHLTKVADELKSCCSEKKRYIDFLSIYISIVHYSGIVGTLLGKQIMSEFLNKLWANSFFCVHSFVHFVFVYYRDVYFEEVFKEVNFVWVHKMEARRKTRAAALKANDCILQSGSFICAKRQLLKQNYMYREFDSIDS